MGNPVPKEQTDKDARLAGRILLGVGAVLVAFYLWGSPSRQRAPAQPQVVISTPTPAPLNPSLIVPGRSLSTVALGMSKVEILSALGAPERVEDKVFLTYVYDRFDLGMTFDLFDRVAEVWTVNPNVATANGLRVGVMASEVERLLGKPQDIEDDATSEEVRRYLGWFTAKWYYHTLGIRFRVRIRTTDSGWRGIPEHVLQVGVMVPK